MMLKLSIKFGFYLIAILLFIEVLIRVFHLTKDTPNRFLDEYNVEKWVPNQQGLEVTGKRRQNTAKFNINGSGFNSYQEYIPSKKQKEIALVGDSFIQGFHQDYSNSIGKKLEKQLPNTKVFEYGYAGYDFADQVHLINAYKKDFELIDQVIIYLNFEDDLSRGKYKVIPDRLALQTPFNNALKKCKLLVYTKNTGLLDTPKKFISNAINFLKGNIGKPASKKTNAEKKAIKNKKNLESISNFKKLINLYGFDKSRFYLLLDSSKTPNKFLTYLHQNNFKVIDYHQPFKKANKPTDLIYDQHWNNYGRELVVKAIINKLKENL